MCKHRAHAPLVLAGKLDWGHIAICQKSPCNIVIYLHDRPYGKVIWRLFRYIITIYCMFPLRWATYERRATQNANIKSTSADIVSYSSFKINIFFMGFDHWLKYIVSVGYLFLINVVQTSEDSFSVRPRPGFERRHVRVDVSRLINICHRFSLAVDHSVFLLQCLAEQSQAFSLGRGRLAPVFFRRLLKVESGDCK